MDRSRKKEPATGSSHAPQPPAPVEPPPQPPVRLWAADAGDDGVLVLYQDPARGVLLIGPADLGQVLRLTAAAREVLRENGFAATPDGAWARPIDPAAILQDRLDAERVLLKAADLHRGDGPSRPTARRGR